MLCRPIFFTLIDTEDTEITKKNDKTNKKNRFFFFSSMFCVPINLSMHIIQITNIYENSNK